jgi:hypothetical protein
VNKPRHRLGCLVYGKRMKKGKREFIEYSERNCTCGLNKRRYAEKKSAQHPGS